ncbi:MAG: hypothetical protein CL904_07340 [Dehalococcoidia bacterium]|nr:hypothetical protein [Dehalococcoidia bacterium]|tara:strand:+ start:688 stop:8892 length:8205 start_codon:yes stop_codon:yes gene_type:complete
MAERAGNRRAVGSAEFSSFDDEWYGRRMQLLLRAGGDRYLKTAPQTLVALASSSKTDNDMLDSFLSGHDQVDFNMMKEKMEAMPQQLQEAEFNSLPPATQKVLLGSGYEIPDASKDALWKRMLTWDIPLLPEEHFGTAVKWGMAPIRAVGFVAGKATSTLWETAIMKPSRFATRLGRTGAYLTQKYAGLSHWDPLDTAQMGNPATWREAWNATKNENDSYYSGTVEAAVDLVGKQQTDLLRAYLTDGQQGVYDLILNNSQGNASVAQSRFEAWQTTLDDQQSLDALKILESGKLTLFDASIRGFNAVSPYDVSPNSVGGKIIGTVGALGIEILLDPMTWVGGAYVKVYKAIKSGVRGSQYTSKLIDLERRIAMTVRAEEKIWDALKGGRARGLFKDLKIWDPNTKTFSDPTDEIGEWIKQPKKSRDAAVEVGGIPVFQPLRDLWQTAALKIGTNPLMLRARGQAHNRFIDRLTSAFSELDAQQLAETQFKKTEAYLDGSKTWKQKQAELIDEGVFSVVDPIGQLVRDLPGLRAIMPDMIKHHMMRRKMNIVVDQGYINENGYFQVIDDFTGEVISQADISGFHSFPDSGVYGHKKIPTEEGWIVWDDLDVDGVMEMKGMTNRSFPTLADHEGYWEFLESSAGMKGLATNLGGVDPEAMWIPAISAFGEQWIKTKRWIRKTQDFYNVDLEAKADMARLTAQFLVKQGNYVHKKVWEGIEEGAIQLSKEIDQLDLDRLLKDPRLTDKAELPHTYDELGLNPEDYQQITEAVETFEKQAPMFILEDGEMSDLYHWYQAEGWHFQKNPDTGILELSLRKPSLLRKPKDLFTRTRNKLEEDYFNKKIHAAGGHNGELDWWTRTGIITRATAVALSYHPAKFAEKLTTYVPKAKHLDLTDPKFGLQEFQALVDMGILADMPRTQIDHFFRDYALGNEADRWRVTTEFYLDFLGRSGAILMGGSDVTRFIERFVRHGHHKYGQVAEDFVGFHNLNIRTAVHPSQEHLAQFAKSNVMPDYRELAAVSRYMSMYRRLGWGLPLPQIDKFMARAWRPAVLLRLGYVARNGGEELATWWWREGPTNYLKQKLARKAVDLHPVWDEYGRRIMMKGTDKLADGKTVADSVRAPLFWRPFSRMWRSFNEFAGVGDYAITTRAIKESIEAKPHKWQFMTEDQRVELFKQVRKGVEKDVRERKFFGKTSKRLFEFADSKANELSLLYDNVRSKIPGLPSRYKLAEKVGRAVDLDHDKRVDAIIRTYTHPTILDAQMKDVLGGFDNYLNFEKNTLDAALRQSGVDSPINNLVQMAMVGLRENRDLKYISTVDSSSIHGVPKSIAVAQRIDMMSGDKATQKFLFEAMHHVPVSTREKLRQLSDKLLEADLDLAYLATANPEVVVLTALRKDPDSLEKLSKAYDNIIPAEALDETGELISSVVSGDLAYIEAVESFIRSKPGEQQWIWEALLNPKDAAGVELGADWNLMAFLLSDVKIDNLTDNFDEAIERGMKAYVKYLSGTPEGQQFILSSHRGAAGGNLKGKLDLPLPPGMTRLFMPMIPMRLAEKYTNMLRPGGGLGREWFNTFVDVLGERLSVIGVSPDEAVKAARLLHPGNIGETLSAQVALMEEWSTTGNYFPIVVGSADDRVANAISETIVDMLDAETLTAADVAQGGIKGMIGALDVNSESLFNQGGFASYSRPEYRTTVTRNGVKGSTEYQTLAEDVTGPFWNDFFGFEGANDPITGEAIGRGAVGSKEFGEGGLKNETMIGVGGSYLLSPKPGGLSPIHVLDGQSQVGTVKIYKDKTGRFILLEEGTEIDPDAIDWFESAELVEEQRVPLNGIRATAEQYALLAKQEIVDLLSSGARRGAGREEWFYPWVREVLSEDPVSAHRIHRAATDGRWWPHAPKDILAFVPVTNEGGSVGEKINDAWTSVLRNWFDGIVNPMIGAMVREPMFQHYLVTGWDQTQSIRRNFDRAKREVVANEFIFDKTIKGRRQYDKGDIFVEGPKGKTKIGTYKTKSIFAEEDLHYVLTRDDTLESFDEFGQYDMQPFTDFAEVEWQLAHTDSDEVWTQIAFAIEKRDHEALAYVLDNIPDRMLEEVHPIWFRVKNLMDMKPTDINGDNIFISMAPTKDPAGTEIFTRRRSVASVQDDFFSMMHHKKRVFETHRDVATQRAMTLTSAYIDDHRIRSQFQQMVGTMVPFWFAEDNFLRRVGRSLKHNPLMLRNLHLTMTAGVYSGLVQTDEFGERKLIIPGSEVATTAMLAIADSTPIVKNVFGGELGSVIRPSMGLATSLKVVPGYDLETIGRMGFGPLLAAPINYLSGRDPEIRQIFENNIIGGRYTGVSDVSSNAESLAKAVWSSFMPAVLTRSLQIAGIDGPEGEARSKAKIDVIKFLAMMDKIPSEEEIANADNPALFQEAFLEKVDAMAKQYQLLQAMTWFFGTGTGYLADLTLNENWEWNSEFYELLELGLPYEQAYPQWVKNIEARTGEDFNAMQFSPFRTSAYEKIPFAVLETTQEANRWLVNNDEFARSFTMASAFFMPRDFNPEDDEYIAEAKQRQINMGLRTLQSPEEFLEQLYFNVSYGLYSQKRTQYLKQKQAHKRVNADTTELDRVWDVWYETFKTQHPVFNHVITTGTSRERRAETLRQFRHLVESPDLIPEGEHKDDVLTVMSTIVGFQNKMDSLRGLNTPDAQQKRDALRAQYYNILESFTSNKPWLNELFYSVFVPLIGESWLAKYDAGNININTGVLV